MATFFSKSNVIAALLAAIGAASSAQAATIDDDRLGFSLRPVAADSAPELSAFLGGFVAQLRNSENTDLSFNLIWAVDTLSANRTGVVVSGRSVLNIGYTKTEVDGFCPSNECTLRMFLAEDVIGTNDSFWAAGSEIRTKLFKRPTEPAFAAAPPPPVPLPAAGWMLFAGLGGLAAFRRARRKN